MNHDECPDKQPSNESLSKEIPTFTAEELYTIGVCISVLGPLREKNLTVAYVMSRMILMDEQNMENLSTLYPKLRPFMLDGVNNCKCPACELRRATITRQE